MEEWIITVQIHWIDVWIARHGSNDGIWRSGSNSIRSSIARARLLRLNNENNFCRMRNIRWTWLVRLSYWHAFDSFNWWDNLAFYNKLPASTILHGRHIVLANYYLFCRFTPECKLVWKGDKSIMKNCPNLLNTAHVCRNSLSVRKELNLIMRGRELCDDHLLMTMLLLM